MAQRGRQMSVLALLAAVAAAVAAALGGCNQGWPKTGRAGEPVSAAPVAAEKVRPAAVAGLFYPNQKDALARQVDMYLAAAKPAAVSKLRGLVCPHAGYDFSGPVAAVAYKQLEGRQVNTVIVMAPSHYAAFEGAALPDADAFETPLGLVPLSPLVKKLAGTGPLAVNPRCEVSRPGWSSQSSREVPPRGEATPHTWEHSLEVQLPFLQRTLSSFSLVPIVFGNVDPAKVAEALDGILDDQTLVVASSDLSHYLPYDVAQQLDASCIRAMCDLDVRWMEGEEACGKGPILALLHLARKHGWRARLLDYRNSGDTSGDKSGVVGYAAVAFYEPEPGEAAIEPLPAPLTPEEGQTLVRLAEETVSEVVRHGRRPSVDAARLPARLTERRACFVTLTKKGELRGCIGSIFPAEPLWQAVVSRAASAATEDPRFSPVRPEELDELEIEVSVLAAPKRLEFASPEELLARLRPHTDGVVLRVGERQATFLPQVWEQIPDKEDFLCQLSRKARLWADAWKNPNAIILTYQVQAFKQAK